MGHKTQDMIDMLFAELSMLFSQVSFFLQTAKSLSPGNTEITESEQPNSGVLGLHGSRFRWVLFRFWALLGSMFFKPSKSSAPLFVRLDFAGFRSISYIS